MGNYQDPGWDGRRTTGWLVARPKFRVTKGPLAGLHGTPVFLRGRLRVLLAADIQRGVYIDVKQSHLERIDQPPVE